MCMDKYATHIKAIIEIIKLMNASTGIHYKDFDTIKIILEDATKIFEEESTIVEASGCYTVVGDIHGNIDALLRIFSKNGYPNTNKYIFLGDYVDRGRNSMEVIVILFAFKVMFPENIILIRGNHEARKMAKDKNNGFWFECKRHFNLELLELANIAFDQLPIGVILNDKVLCLHGGIPRNIKNRDQLMSIKKNNGERSHDFVGDILWSDPSANEKLIGKSPRYAGRIFGYQETKDFLRNLDLSLIIRAHQECMNGFNYPFHDKCLITIFSSINYVGSNNSAGILKFDQEEPFQYEIEVFPPVSAKSCIYFQNSRLMMTLRTTVPVKLKYLAISLMIKLHYLLN